jgi:hypothetical protein
MPCVVTLSKITVSHRTDHVDWPMYIVLLHREHFSHVLSHRNVIQSKQDLTDSLVIPWIICECDTYLLNVAYPNN